ncbi:unnamed protein product, partial [Amoebophrya sp. A25]
PGGGIHGAPGIEHPDPNDSTSQQPASGADDQSQTKYLVLKKGELLEPIYKT